MRLRDLLDPERALAALMKLALALILVAVGLQLFVCMVRQIAPAAGFVMLCVFLLLSPLAYFIRQKRQGISQRSGARRGAERTPLLPQNEEAE
jgi:Ca2+/H+ antiporter